MIESKRKEYENVLAQELEKRYVLQDLISQGLPADTILSEIVSRGYISEEDLRDIIERYRRPITDEQLFRLLLDESLEIQDAIDLLLDEGAIKSEIPQLLVEGGYITAEDVSRITDRYQNQQVFDRLSTLFGTEMALDKAGLDRYCCRRMMLNPAKLPQGTGVQVGKVIRTKEAQNAIQPINPVRAVQQQSTLGTQRPVQQLGRIGGSPATQTRTIPLTRTISSTPIQPLAQPSAQQPVSQQPIGQRTSGIVPRQTTVAPRPTLVPVQQQQTGQIRPTIQPLQRTTQRM